MGNWRLGLYDSCVSDLTRVECYLVAGNRQFDLATATRPIIDPIDDRVPAHLFEDIAKEAQRGRLDTLALRLRAEINASRPC